MTKQFTNLISENYGYILKPLRDYIPAEWQADVQQEILAAAWSKFPTFRGDSKFSTWLYKVALYECYNWSRKIRRPRLDFIEQNESTVFQHEPLFASMWPSLGEIYQDALILRYLKGLSIAEIGQLLGRRPNSVKTILARAKQKFEICN